MKVDYEPAKSAAQIHHQQTLLHEHRKFIRSRLRVLALVDQLKKHQPSLQRVRSQAGTLEHHPRFHRHNPGFLTESATKAQRAM